MLLSLKNIENLLRCPSRNIPVFFSWNGEILESACSGGDEYYHIIKNQPVLIDFEESLFDESWYLKVQVSYSHTSRGANWLRLLKGNLIGSNKVSRANFDKLKDLMNEELMSSCGDKPIVLMVGGGTKGGGSETLYEDDRIDLISFDVYPSSCTSFVADAHSIPLKDESVDAVCVQAVLEHVLDPAGVVDEIFRVLRPNGIVYAETPFMQQVHEGAHDFTRFTELGHRWLWRSFEAIERGTIGGPGLTFYWSIKYLFLAIFKKPALAKVMSAPFLAVALLDKCLSDKSKIDGANGCYFLGRKKEAEPMRKKSILSTYMGVQR